MKTRRAVPLIIALGMIATTYLAFAALSSYNTYKPPSYAPYGVARPAYQVWNTEHYFGSQIKRISGDYGSDLIYQRPGDAATTWPEKAIHHYSLDQPWNVTGKVLAMDFYDAAGNGAGHYYLDGVTYSPLWAKCTTYSIGDDRWLPDANYPYVRVNAKGKVLEWYDVSTCRQVKKINLNFTVNGIGGGKGNLSKNGRYVVLNDATRMFAVDMWNSTVGPTKDISACGLKDVFGLTTCVPSNITISPSGNYVVISINDLLRVYDMDSNTLALTPHAYDPNTYECYHWEDPNGEYDPNGPTTGVDPNTGSIFSLGHYDVAVSPFDANADIAVGQRRPWCPNPIVGSDPNDELGQVVAVRLSNGVPRAVTKPVADPNSVFEDEEQAWHISARATARPGWVYVTYWANYLDVGSDTHYWLSDPNTLTRYQDEIVAISLDPNLIMDPNAGVERLGQTHSSRYFLTGSPGQYRAEPHFVPDPNGVKGLFASNWYLDCGTVTGHCDPNSLFEFQNVHAYVLDTTYLKTGAAAGGKPRTIYQDTGETP